MSRPFQPRGGIVLVPPPPSSARRSDEPAEFAAPAGWVVRLIPVLIAVSLVAIGAGSLLLRTQRPLELEKVWPLTIGPVVALPILGAIFFQQRILGYRLTDRDLVVRRHGRENVFALDGLRSADVDPKAMNWSVRIFGNGGLGAITGRFRNLRLGSYQALVTDRARAVVLRWPDRCLVVSPDRPEEFAVEIRRRAGLPDPSHG